MRKPQVMSSAARLVTAEELEKFPRDDRRYELVQGRLVRMSPVSWSHAQIVMQFGALLLNHVKPRKLGGVGTEAGFTLSRNPDTVRAPDVAFIRQDRLSSSRPRGFWQGAPDLAVEVLSPDDSAADVATKVQEYLGFGVPLVLVIDPRTQIVTTHRRSATSVTLNAPDALIDLSDVVPGFRCTVAEIFE